MNSYSPPSWRQWLRNTTGWLFNLNDPRWGRPEGSNAEDDKKGDPPPQEERPQEGRRPVNAGGPPDLDVLWRDFNRKLGQLFGGKSGNGPNGSGSGKGGAGIGLGLVVSAAVLIWLGTGLFIVQEGQRAVVTQFGKYKETVDAGVNWRMPFPFEQHELVYVTQIRSMDVGRDSVIKATGLKDSAMLTQDENIVDIKFAVQYRLSDARAYLFESKDPEQAMQQVAETSVREVLGKMKMDAALSEERDQIAVRVRTLMQSILDRYNVGIEVVAVNLQQGGVRPPEQVQSAFDDVLKAGQERERSKNEAQAYANNVVPGAVGTASRLKEEADAYKSRVVARAQGDAQRFRSVLDEYQKAPQVTRDRMYLDAMQEIYSGVTKVLVDSKQGSNLLYLPLDKLLQVTAPGKPADATSAAALPADSGTPPSVVGGAGGGVPDARSRDSGRSRDRDVR